MQQRLRKQADLVWELLQAGAHFYVCGDAAHMASAVEEALLDILTQKLVSSHLLLASRDQFAFRLFLLSLHAPCRPLQKSI